MGSGTRAEYIFQICSTTHCSSPPIEAKMKELGQRLFRVMKILVPVDGSPASIRAVKLAIDQAKAVAGASIVVVNVQNLSTLGLAEAAGIMPLPWIEQEEERASSARGCHRLPRGRGDLRHSLRAGRDCRNY
jgi:hypothetical protein